MNSGDIRTAFAGGQVAMNFDWGDTGTIAVDPKQSKVAGHVGFFVLPGSDEMYNYKTRQWDKLGKVIHTPFMAYGGWTAMVPASSQVQDCAWDYIEWYASPDNSIKDVTTGGTGINPYRQSHFANIAAWVSGGTFDDAEAKNYLEVQRDSIDPKKYNVALDVRIPGYFQYTEVLEIELSKALAGDEKPQEALDTIAKQWNQLTDDLGRDKQLAAYRALMGLPPKK
jgi:multiple sugar transport system substrate-binding protein